ncbi:unnamed protein product [Colias eurytheme]|nr:unnamed protein product [Colias eurytheme]
MSGDLQTQDVHTNQQKSRIPQRLPAGRQRFQLRSKANTNVDPIKNKLETAQQPRFNARSSPRPRSGEQARPKSANRVKEEINQVLQSQPAQRMVRVMETDTQKKILPTRRNVNDRQKFDVPPAYRSPRTITVPVKQKQTARNPYNNKTCSILPDQETIKRCEELEAQDDFGYLYDLYDSNETFTENDEESITTRSEKVVQLQMNWQEKLAQFEKMKRELNDRQNTILQMYATLRGMQQQLSKLGQKASLPTTENLKVMNVSNMSPAQLLQLCEESKRIKDEDISAKQTLPIDVNRLNNIPMKLVTTCEQILAHQRDLTSWFKNLITQEKECSISLLSKKLMEFNSENEMLNGLLHTGQNEFLKESGEIMEFLRKCINETMPLQLRNEQLTYEISDLNSKIIDLRKQLHTAEQLKSQNHRAKIEELEKELKEEKMERASLRKRLTHCNCEVKMEKEKSTNLDAALKQARIQTRNLDRTVLQLQEQNERLQSDFDTELNKLNESIKENTAHLEEIADAREKLQSEKEDLEKRLEELSTHYTESLCNLKHELNNKITLLIEAEKKYNIEMDENKRLKEIVETQCAQLVEAELRYKDLCQKLQEFETQISERDKKLESVEGELLRMKSENEHCQNRLMEQGDTIKEFEGKFKESRLIEERLRNDLKNKEDCIVTLEKKKCHLENLLRDSESKMELYEEQLSSLKTHILQLQECFGEYENMNDLREMLNLHKNKVQEMTRKNNELAETLQRRNIDLEVHLETIARQEHALKQNEEIIKVLSQKEEEQANIIKLLRNNLEIRSQKDSELNSQITEKNEEINVLINSLETRKGQISQLEKIILTLEDQIRETSQQKRNNDEKIDILEQQNQEYKSYMDDRNNNESRAKNLDTLFEILEDELGNSFEQQYNIKGDGRNNFTSKHMEQQLKQEYTPKQKLFETEYAKNGPNVDVNHFDNKPVNYKKVKKENMSRKKATQLETLKWISGCDNCFVPTLPSRKNTFAPPIREAVTVGHSKDKYVTRNLPLFVPNNFQDDRQYKMLKLASHRM